MYEDIDRLAVVGSVEHELLPEVEESSLRHDDTD